MKFQRNRLGQWMLVGLLATVAAFTVACGADATATAVPVASALAETETADTAVLVNEPATSAAVTTELANETMANETMVGETAVTHLQTNAPAQDLSAAEIDGLTFMREEEKLAHDVYLTLYEQWGMPVFQNIAASEQQHTDAVLALLTQYGIVDPASAATGVFNNSDLQALYNQLVAQGSQSLTDALRVGAAIEEIDILDLQERIALTTNSDIVRVYENLLSGSGNHLQAFAGALTRQTGETYQPQYLSQDAYDAILNGAHGSNGNGNGRSADNGSQGNGGNGRGSGNGNGNGRGNNGQGNGNGRNGG